MRPEVRFERVVRGLRAGLFGEAWPLRTDADGSPWAGMVLLRGAAWVAVRGAAIPASLPRRPYDRDPIFDGEVGRARSGGVAVAAGALSRALPRTLTSVEVGGTIVAARYLHSLLTIARGAELVTVHRDAASQTWQPSRPAVVIYGEGDTWRAGVGAYNAPSSPHAVDLAALAAVTTEARS